MSDGLFVCVDCGYVFSKPRKYIETHGFDCPPYEKFTGCPKCGGSYTIAKRCKHCGEVIIGNFVDIPSLGEFCENCYTLRNTSDQ